MVTQLRPHALRALFSCKYSVAVWPHDAERASLRRKQACPFRLFSCQARQFNRRVKDGLAEPLFRIISRNHFVPIVRRGGGLPVLLNIDEMYL